MRIAQRVNALRVKFGHSLCAFATARQSVPLSRNILATHTVRLRLRCVRAGTPPCTRRCLSPTEVYCHAHCARAGVCAHVGHACVQAGASSCARRLQYIPCWVCNRAMFGSPAGNGVQATCSRGRPRVHERVPAYRAPHVAVKCAPKAHGGQRWHTCVDGGTLQPGCVHTGTSAPHDAWGEGSPQASMLARSSPASCKRGRPLCTATGATMAPVARCVS